MLLMKTTVEKHLTGEFGHVEDLVEAYLYAMRGRNVSLRMQEHFLLDRMT